MDSLHEKYIKRCFQLARISRFNTGTNPTVGAVLTYRGNIIGEGYYQHYGGDHAEKNAINSVKPEDRKYIPESELYVSLEPCCIQGKTPPCSELILREKIKKLRISTNDPNPKMNGQSIKILKSHGVEIIENILPQEGADLIKPFKAHLNKRPYVILKFAQSSDGYFGKRDKQVWISNKYSRIKTHKWRSEIDSILVGKTTAQTDNPSLTCRYFPGRNPVRIILDKNLELPQSLNVWADDEKSIFISSVDTNIVLKENKEIAIIDHDDGFVEKLLPFLFQKGICSVMVEGGAKTLKRFRDSGIWDEARIITSDIKMNSGIRAPMLTGRVFHKEILANDQISYLYSS